MQFPGSSGEKGIKGILCVAQNNGVAYLYNRRRSLSADFHHLLRSLFVFRDVDICVLDTAFSKIRFRQLAEGAGGHGINGDLGDVVHIDVM